MATNRAPDDRPTERRRDWALLLRACRADVADLGVCVAERFPARRAGDWDGFLRLMDQQGTGPLAASALLSVHAHMIPEEVRASLRERVRLGALRAAIQVPELLAILEALDGRGIEAIAHMGPTLSALAFGRAGVRDSVDLDLVVRERDVTAAEQVLRGRGYRRNSPGDLRPRLEAGRRRAWNETEFVSADGWIFVDLHWHLYPRQFPFRVDLARLWARPARAALEGRTVRVFPVETLVALLCLHGAKDTWRKMIWLCDVDRVIRVSPALDWEKVRAFAEESHCRRAVGLSLLLAHRLFDTPLPVEVVAPLAGDETLMRLLARVEDELATGGIRSPWWLARFGVRPFHLAVFDTWRDGAVYTGRALVTPLAWDWELVKVHLPDSLYGLKYLLRPLRLLATLPRDALRRIRLRPGGDRGFEE
jgi:hypothetical protein